jgi:membrane protein implicated in regulation of membrane protease activity
VIPEAIAAAESVIRALLLWIVIAAALATAALFAVLAAGWAVWRTTVAAAKAVCAWLSWRPAAELPPHAPTEGADAPVAPRGRTANPVPAWARTEEEAA